jgi:hypothetical protein
MYQAVPSPTPTPEDEWLGALTDTAFELPPFTAGIQPARTDSCEHNGLVPDNQPQSGGEEGTLASSGPDNLEATAKGSNGSLDDTLSTWYPLSLQRYTIHAFIATFTVLIIALETIFIISERRQGLATSLSGTSLYYTWTYGPTAVVSLTSAVWLCVDYSAKVSAPWIRIRNAKSDTEVKSALLLDYISPFSFLVPFRAIKNKDVLVAAAALVSQFLTIMVIFSSSIIRAELVDVTLPVRLRSKFVDDPSRLGDPGLLPVYNAIGLKWYHLEYPHGISEQFVYQSFEPSPDSTLEMRVTLEGLSATLDCRSASITGLKFTTSDGTDPLAPITVLEHTTIGGTDPLASITGLKYTTSDGTDPLVAQPFTVNATFDLSIPGCDLRNHSVPVLSNAMYSVDSDDMIVNFTSLERVARVLRGECQPHQDDPQSVDLNPRRLALVVADFLVHVTTRTSNETSTSNITSISCKRSEQLVCEPRYTISNIDIVLDNTTKQNSISLAGIPRAGMISRVHAWDIADAVLDTFERGYDLRRISNVLGYIELGRLPNDIIVAWDLDRISVAVLGLGQPNFPDANSVFNSTALSLSLQTYYRTHAAFLVHNALMEPISELSTTGYTKVPQNRLVVQPLASQVLVAFSFLSIVVLCVGRSALPPKFTLAGDPRTILGLKALAKTITHNFPKGLGGCGSLDLKVGVYRLPTGLTGEARRHSYHGDGGVSNSGRRTRKPTAHQPFSLRLDSRATVCVAIAGTIILLEILLRKSQKDNDGIGTASPPGTYLHYLWTLLPILGSSLIGMFFLSTDSELQTLVPFYAMHSAPSPVRQSVNLNLRGLLGVHALYRQIKTRHFAAAMATVTAMVASLLTIASASLFFEEDRPLVSQQHLRLVGSFSSAMYRDDYIVSFGLYSGLDPGVTGLGIIPTLMLQSNLSAPAFTYQGLAFPTLALDANTSTQLNSAETEIHTVVPALRGGLACHQHPQADIVADILHLDHPLNMTFPYNGLWPAGNTIRVNVTGEFCPGRAEEAEPATPELFVTALFYQDDPEALEGTFAANEPMEQNITLGLHACSSYVYIWGHYSSGSVSASVLSCNASIESVDVEAVFLGDKLAIHPNHPPKPKEETVHEVISATNSMIQFKYSVYRDLSSFLLKAPGAIMDSFFAALVTSPYGIPLSALADPALADTVADAIKFQHSIVMAQTLSSTSRIPFPGYNQFYQDIPNDTGVFDRTGQGTLNTTTYPATAMNLLGGTVTTIQHDNSTVTTTTTRRRRVIQDPAATRVMQGLLGATLLFAVLSWALLAPRTAAGILPRPPTSIASVLALLVDGDVYDWGGDDEKVGGKPPGQMGSGDGEAVLITSGKGKQIDGEGKKTEERYGFWLGTRSSRSESTRTLPLRPPDSDGHVDDEGEPRFGIWVVDMQQTPSHKRRTPHPTTLNATPSE